MTINWIFHYLLDSFHWNLWIENCILRIQVSSKRQWRPLLPPMPTNNNNFTLNWSFNRWQCQINIWIIDVTRSDFSRSLPTSLSHSRKVSAHLFRSFPSRLVCHDTLMISLIIDATSCPRVKLAIHSISISRVHSAVLRN